MRILVLGSGAREHAIVRALLSEGAGHDVLVAPGNAGIAREARTVALDADDPQAVVDFALQEDVDLVVIGPEAPLVAGVADEVRTHGIPVFGPDRAAAALEGSKSFAKRVMADAGVPTGRAAHARTLADAERLIDEYGAPYVVKADGLAAGKGVLVTEDRAAALAHAEHWLMQGDVLIEEHLRGPEVSLFVVSDGATAVPLAPAQDFKRALDGDAGPNTGGMGAYSPLPWLPEGFTREVVETIALPVIRQLDREGTPFIGLLYCGLIVTEAGVRVIEFNARFGDPETQVVLARLATPLSGLLLAAASGTLAGVPWPEFRDEAAVTVVLASEGYPESPVTGRPLTGLEEAAAVPGTHLLHAATTADADGGRLLASGGRVLNVVATAPNLAQARERAYQAIGRIGLDGGHYRRDIAEQAAALPAAATGAPAAEGSA